MNTEVRKHLAEQFNNLLNENLRAIDVLRVEVLTQPEFYPQLAELLHQAITKINAKIQNNSPERWEKYLSLREEIIRFPFYIHRLKDRFGRIYSARRQHNSPHLLTQVKFVNQQELPRYKKLIDDLSFFLYQELEHLGLTNPTEKRIRRLN